MRLRTEEKAVYSVLKKRVLIIFQDPVKTMLLVMGALCDFITLSIVCDSFLRSNVFFSYPVAMVYSFFLAVPPAIAGDSLRKYWNAKGGKSQETVNSSSIIRKSDHGDVDRNEFELIIKIAISAVTFLVALQLFVRVIHASINGESITGAVFFGLLPVGVALTLFLVYFASTSKSVEDAKESNQETKRGIVANRINAQRKRLGSTKDFGEIQMILVEENTKACLAGADRGHDARVVYSQTEMARKKGLEGAAANKMIVDPYHKKREKEAE